MNPAMNAIPRRQTAMCALLVSMLAAAAWAQLVPDLGFTTRVSAGLIARYTRLFGSATPGRLAHWMGFAKEQKASAFMQRLDAARERESEVLQGVNDAINGSVEWVDDATHWGVEDYWATPAESVASAGGDCEDFSIAKYFLLKEFGVPLDRLRITYVRALKLKGQGHMVLAYYARPDAEPLILDNMEPTIRRATLRPDLEPVYSFNDEEAVLLQGALKGKPSQIRAWRSLQERLVAESRT